MTCPNCGTENNSIVLDSRPKKWGIYRKRKCLCCGYRFSTAEVYEYTEDAFDFIELTQKMIDKRTNFKEKKK